MDGDPMINDLIEDLKRDEGVRDKPYLCTAGKLTIGVGRNLDDVGINGSEIAFLLRSDITNTMDELDRAFSWFQDAPDAVRRGLANMHFNLGLPRLLGFKRMLEALRMEEYERAATEALDSRWARQVGQRAERIADLYRSAADL